MSEVKRGIVATLSVVLGASAVIGGVSYRNAVDLGRSLDRQASLTGLVASASGQDVPEAAYFDQLATLIENEYVDPITDMGKLADGAVRGMVTRLDDPHCLYFDKANLENFKAARNGTFEGIGVGLVVRYGDKGDANSVRLPRLLVAEVAKGSPAERNGMKPGDRIISIDGHWILNSEELEAFRRLVSDKNTPSDILLKERKSMRDKLKTGIMPMRAFEKLTTGKSGESKIVWKRGSEQMSATVAKSVTVDTATFRFNYKAPEKLRQLVSSGQPLTLDLRGNAHGDGTVLTKCLSVIAPAGDYGFLVREKKEETTPLQLEGGLEKPLKITILVDSNTRGAAEAFARAAKLAGHTVQGKTAGDAVLTQLHEFPNGTGYTLAFAEYSEVKR